MEIHDTREIQQKEQKNIQPRRTHIFFFRVVKSKSNHCRCR